MRIVHLLTSDGGGAGRSALRLHQGLMSIGQESMALVKTKTSSEPKVEAFSSEFTHETTELFRFRVVQEFHVHANRTALSNTHYSLGYPGWDLAAHPAVLSADIIHLHWVADWLSPISISRLLALNKPVVWTLHDQRPFTGGCHFSGGCQKYHDDCGGCPQLKNDPLCLAGANFHDQSAFYGGERIRIVSPSTWLAECARASRIFKKNQIHTIPYGLDTEIFQPRPKPEARAALGLDIDRLCLLFGAANAIEKRKGFADLLQTLSICGADPAFRTRNPILLCFGEPGDALRSIGFQVRSLGRVDSDEMLSSAYSAADLFILPTLEDNLPNTMLEAISCGTPVAAFATGGVPDAVLDGQTGRLAPTGDVGALARVVLEMAQDEEGRANMSRTCRNIAVQRFSLRAQAKAYESLYQQLGSSQPSPIPPSADIGIITEVGPNFGRIFDQLVSIALNGVSPEAYLEEKAVEKQLQEIRRGAWPWPLNPTAWILRAKRNALKKARLQGP